MRKEKGIFGGHEYPLKIRLKHADHTGCQARAAHAVETVCSFWNLQYVGMYSTCTGTYCRSLIVALFKLENTTGR